MSTPNISVAEAARILKWLEVYVLNWGGGAYTPLTEEERTLRDKLIAIVKAG